jgi:predicted metal-binding membrane protein
MGPFAALSGQVRCALRRETILLLAGLSAAGFLLAATSPSAAGLSAICGMAAFSDLPDLAVLWVAFASPRALALDWLVMVLAMMPLLTAQPVAHVWRCSLTARRLRAVAGFAAGYGACWVAAGLVLIPAAAAAGAILPPGARAPILLAAALVWSGWPRAQAARIRCHRLRRIGAFGLGAWRDCLWQGVTTGSACVATCWPWMLVPMAVGTGHVLVMLVVTLVLLAERMMPPVRARWRLPPALVAIAGPAPWGRKVRGAG